MGNYLDKVGRTTGWTTGQISRTCADILRSGNRAFLCQDEVEALADYGDSGSPVFRFEGGSDVSFAGILWAKTADGGFLFSNKGRIEADLGGGANYKWY